MCACVCSNNHCVNLAHSSLMYPPVVWSKSITWPLPLITFSNHLNTSLWFWTLWISLCTPLNHLSLAAMSLPLGFCASRKGRRGGGGGRQVSALGWDSIAASGFSSRRSLVGTRWAISLLPCTTGLRVVFWPCRAFISGSEVLFSVCMGDHWPRAVTVESSLASRCGLSQESAQDGWNGSG